MPDPHEALNNALRDRYELEDVLGEGGMGTVYLARDLKHDRPVAIKTIHPDLTTDEVRQRFEREISITAHLQHPYILPLLDSGVVGEIFYYVMPYVEGESLRARLKRSGKLPVQEAVKIACDVAEALEHAHRHDVVHRDIKPSNILLTQDDVTPVGVDHALVVDFGIAKALAEADIESDTLTRTGHVVGTPAYMAPEQTIGETTPSSDVYSLGAVLYEMVTGRRWPIPTSAEPDWTGVPSVLRPVLERALNLLPRDRWPDAAAFHEALTSAFAGRPARPKRLALKPAVAGGVVALALMGGAVGVGWAPLSWPGSDSAGEEVLQSIAVLPFVDMSAAGDQEYFSDGMSEEILDALAQIPNLQVAARTSSFRFRGADSDVRAIADSLGVEAVLEGSVRIDGERVRITAQLINAENGFHLWSESFDRQLEDIFSVQQEIARAIVGALGVLLPAEAETQLVSEQTSDFEAYNLYLRGRYFWNQRTKDGLETAANYFQQAIDRDSVYALAYAGLADAYSALGAWRYVPQEEVLPRAEEAADRALELDETLAEAHTARGLILYLQEEYDDAELAYSRAIELNPSYATAHQWYGLLLGVMSRPQEALGEFRRAHELDPLSVQVSTQLGWQLSQLHQFDEALEQYERALEFSPDHPWTQGARANLLRRLGRFEEALPAARRAKELSPNFNSTAVAWVHHWARDYEAALAELESILENEPDLFDAHWLLSQVYAAQGRYEEAIEEHRTIEQLRASPFNALNLFFIYARSGDTEKARRILSELETLEDEARWEANLGWIGAAHAWLGEYDLAFEWLDRALEVESVSLTEFKVDQWADALRSDPRFDELLRKLGLS